MNERPHHITASSLPRIAKCRGSWTASQGLESKSTADSAEGTDRHALIELGAVELADDQGQEICLQRAQLLTEKAMLATGFDGPDITEFSEVRLYSQHIAFSGQIDRYFVDRDGRALIVDYKTLYGNHTESAANKQLMGYVALVAEHHDCDEIFVALIQPMSAGEKALTIARYDSRSLKYAIVETHNLVRQAELPDAARNAGEWCKHCPARMTDKCPESSQFALSVAFSNALTQPVTADLFRKVKTVKKMIADLEKQITERVEAEGLPDGLTWSKPRVTPTITSAGAVWQSIGKEIGSEAFQDACKISINDLVKPFQVARGVKTQQEAKKALMDVLAHVIEHKESKPYLMEE